MGTNPNEDQIKSDLYNDISKLARENDSDSNNFLESLTNIIESDDYEQVVGEIVSEENMEFDSEEKVLQNSLEADTSIDEYIQKAGDNLKNALNSDLFSKNKTKTTDAWVDLDKTEESIDSVSIKEEIIKNTISDDYIDNDIEYNDVISDIASDDIEIDIDAQMVKSNESDSNALNSKVNDTDNDTQNLEANKNHNDNIPATTEDDIKALELKKKNKKKQNLMYNLIMVACFCVFAYCIGKIGVYYYQHYQYKKGMSKLQDIVGDISSDVVINKNVEVVNDVVFPDELVYANTTSSAANYNNEISDKWAQTYQTLTEANPDCIGWLMIPDTNINYPVMYTPEQYDKYLYTDFEGKYLYRGLPFIGEGTLLNESQNYIIYGHRMADGTAFNNLSKYLYGDFAKEHPYAYFNTAYGEGVYQLMDVVITKIFNTDDECFKYYKYTGALSEEEFNTYVYYMGMMSQINTGVTAVYGDHLISLSTCFRDYDPEGRLVIVFKRIQ